VVFRPCLPWVEWRIRHLQFLSTFFLVEVQAENSTR
jgi:hypothetical protein